MVSEWKSSKGKAVKCFDLAIRGLNPHRLQRKAYQKLIEDLSKDWKKINDCIITNARTFAIATELTRSSGLNKLKLIKNKINVLTKAFRLSKAMK